MLPQWRIIEFRGLSGLRELESDWRRLVALVPDRGPQHAYETHLAYFTHLCETEDGIRCLALTDGDQLRAICPIRPASTHIFGWSTKCVGLMCWRGGLLLDVICPPGEAELELLPRVVRFLNTSSSRPRWLVFDRVLEGSTLWRCLAGLDRRSFCLQGRAPTEVVPCDRSFRDYSAELPKKFRGNLRNARNKLALLADVRFETADRAPDLLRAFEAFVELEASGWKGEAGTRSAMKWKPDQLGYHRELAAATWRNGACEINSLHAEGACIASTICLRVGSEYQIARISYDERYARSAPGQLLLERILERCCESPEIRVANLQSEAEWFRNWRPKAVPSHAVHIGLGERSGPLRVRLFRAQLRYAPTLKKTLARVRRTRSPLGTRTET